MSVYTNYNEALPQGTFVLLSGLTERLHLKAQIIAKLDFWGPSGNIYDRVAAEMLDIALQNKRVKPGDTVIEASSGFFAVSFAIAAGRQGLRSVLCVPETLSEKRQKLLTSLGAKLQYIPTTEGRIGGLQRAAALEKEGAGYFLNYLENDNNPEVHRRTTGPEILSALGDTFHYLVCTVNSGGTISGTAEHIKAWTNGIQVIAVEPYENQVLNGGFAGRHGITGIGLPFVPANYNPYVVDKIMPVTTGDAISTADLSFFTDGIPVAVAGGAALTAAVELARNPDNAGKHIVVVLPARRNF